MGTEKRPGKFEGKIGTPCFFFIQKYYIEGHGFCAHNRVTLRAQFSVPWWYNYPGGFSRCSL